MKEISRSWDERFRCVNTDHFGITLNVVVLDYDRPLDSKIQLVESVPEECQDITSPLDCA